MKPNKIWVVERRNRTNRSRWHRTIYIFFTRDGARKKARAYFAKREKEKKG
jgi:hypothetical protein